ncbi:hypothetical protein F1188_16085 [Roseospira marina]|uniref:Uncharacterized protein n=1 Tax=Roseospira marina TaxID=140057 RepID=A0A5M6I9J1_9PROT|nr:hypothetical protein [Roseospira marina]KAA5604379.1 hypothetical protein F1188_16085 [Roseospira marina]MBB4315433.1 hypothetical protein [Roseospira marina]MBB5088421.1 hypothetical protein [Roseospira marina]
MSEINWSELTDDEFVKQAERVIWSSAFANNNSRAPAHKEANAASDEAQARGKPWLYQRAWNAAYRSCGHEPSESDIAAAHEPVAEKNDDIDTARLRKIVEKAHDMYAKDGLIEIDEPADDAALSEMVSEGDDPGCYVRAWVWVPVDENDENEEQ